MKFNREHPETQSLYYHCTFLCLVPECSSNSRCQCPSALKQFSILLAKVEDKDYIQENT